MTTIEVSTVETRDLVAATYEAARLRNVFPLAGKILDFISAPQTSTHPHERRRSHPLPGRDSQELPLEK